LKIISPCCRNNSARFYWWLGKAAEGCRSPRRFVRHGED
jgi:hypothetical protein